jgi:RNA polymerase sigma factor (sigma-70 family)
MTEAPLLVDASAARALLARRDAFVAYVQRRVGDRALAEDVVQEAYAKGLERAASVGDDEGAVRWFYATLRNAVVDLARRRATARKALLEFAGELASATAPSPEDLSPPNTCQCITREAKSLHGGYADALHRIDVEGLSVKGYAERAGISANNAAVRVFRARQALRERVLDTCGACASEGCVDCTCAQA